MSGLQLSWRVLCRSPGGSVWHEFTGPRHGGGSGAQGRDLELAPGEAVLSASVHSGAVVDRLELATSRGRTWSWGGPGGSRGLLFEASPNGSSRHSVLLGLAGGMGGHLHHLAAITVSVDPGPEPPWAPPVWAAAPAYGFHAGFALRAAFAAVVTGACPPDEAPETSSDHSRRDAVMGTLAAAAKYCTNLAAKGGTDHRVRAIKLTNSFADNQLGKVPAGLCLAAAASFRCLEWRLGTLNTSEGSSSAGTAAGDLFLVSDATEQAAGQCSKELGEIMRLLRGVVP